MEKVKKSDLLWSMVELQANGAKGLIGKYSYLKSIQGISSYHGYTAERDIPVDGTLVSLFNLLSNIVVKVENYDSVLELAHSTGFEPTDRQLQFIEAKADEQSEKVTVFGIKISLKKDIEGVIMEYIKYDSQDVEKKEKTNWICIGGDIHYGIEESLKKIVDEIKKEAYEYFFNYKYSGREQLIIEHQFEDVEDNE